MTDPAAEGIRAGRREANIRKSIKAMDSEEFGQLKDAYYKAAEGLASLAEALRPLGGAEHDYAMRIERDFDEDLGVLGGIL